MNYFGKEETIILKQLLITNFENQKQTKLIYDKINHMVKVLVSIYYKRYFMNKNIKEETDIITSDIFNNLIRSKEHIINSPYDNFYSYINKMITNEIKNKNLTSKLNNKNHNVDVYRKQQNMVYFEDILEDIPLPQTYEDNSLELSKIILQHLKYTYLYRRYIFKGNTIKVLDIIYNLSLNHNIFDRSEYITICMEQTGLSKRKISSIIGYLLSPHPYSETKPNLFKKLKEKYVSEKNK